LYLIIEGRVKVCRMTGEARDVVVDIYGPGEFFGEAAFLGKEQAAEFAVALEKTVLVTWTISEIEEIADRRPKLPLALLQLLVQRSADLGARVESFAVDNIARRLVRSLVRFSERLGEEAEDGSVQMIPLTQELLAQYVGASRSLVTRYMSHFRRRDFCVTRERESYCIGRSWTIGCATEGVAGDQIGGRRRIS